MFEPSIATDGMLGKGAERTLSKHNLEEIVHNGL
jgi:hypothetical protein